jgi:hypothetical protein
MTPPFDFNATCTGCFLYERRGVCPMARDAYGPESPESQRQAELLRVAIRSELPDGAPNLIQLIQQEVQRRTQERLPTAPRLLPAAPAQSIPNNPQKEPINGSHARSTVR